MNLRQSSYLTPIPQGCSSMFALPGRYHLDIMLNYGNVKFTYDDLTSVIQIVTRHGLHADVCKLKSGYICASLIWKSTTATSQLRIYRVQAQWTVQRRERCSQRWWASYSPYCMRTLLRQVRYLYLVTRNVPSS